MYDFSSFFLLSIGISFTIYRQNFLNGKLLTLYMTQKKVKDLLHVLASSLSLSFSHTHSLYEPDKIPEIFTNPMPSYDERKGTTLAAGRLYFQRTKTPYDSVKESGNWDLSVKKMIQGYGTWASCKNKK